MADYSDTPSPRSPEANTSEHPTHISPQILGANAISQSFEDTTVKPEVSIDNDQKIRELVTNDFDGEDPDALFPLSGGITQRKDGRWSSLGGSDVSEHGLVTIGKTRVIAGAKIAQLFPDAKIVANSYNRFNPDDPTMASVVKDELGRRKVPEEQIILEEESFNTVTQYTEMIKLAVQQNWQKLTVIINEYYVDRATALYDHLDTIVEDEDFQGLLSEFKSRGGKVSFVLSDEILTAMSDHFTRYLDEVKQTEPYKKTVAMEAQGVNDIMNNKYRAPLSPEKPRK